MTRCCYAKRNNSYVIYSLINQLIVCHKVVAKINFVESYYGVICNVCWRFNQFKSYQYDVTNHKENEKWLETWMKNIKASGFTAMLQPSDWNNLIFPSYSWMSIMTFHIIWHNYSIHKHGWTFWFVYLIPGIYIIKKQLWDAIPWMQWLHRGCNENKSTTASHLRLLTKFLQSKGGNSLIHSTPPMILHCNPKRTKNDNEYEPISLRSMISSFDRHLRR